MTTTTKQTETTMTPSANICVLNAERPEYKTFRLHLATWCNQWVMEIAQPIMESCSSLYEDAAVCILVEKWFEVDSKYRNGRRSYLLQLAENVDDEHALDPLASYEWVKGDRDAYNEALRALLIK